MKIYIVDIENIPTRYTSQWKEWIPSYFDKAQKQFEVIDGPEQDDYETTPGGFFNFFETNNYKMVQGQKISKLFVDNKVNNGDIFLFTDAWHPAIFSLRQMINLSKKTIKIYGMFHAGAYDPADILGQTCRHNFLHMEIGLLESMDKAFFATNFSKQLMLDNLPLNNALKEELSKKMKVTGFPYEFDHLYSVGWKNKKNQILFPHRISPEKHIELFRKQDKVSDTYKSLDELAPDYDCIVTLEVVKNKDEFHKLLAESKFTVSFADQETWGISVFESLVSGCIPIVPDKLSYVEMYTDEIRYNVYDCDGEQYIYDWPERVLEHIRTFEYATDDEINDFLEENIKRLKKYFCTFDNIMYEIELGD